MKFFLDTEFIEDGETIDLISIALVPENQEDSYYAISEEFNPFKACNWVIENVLQHLPPAPSYSKIHKCRLPNMFIDKQPEDKIWYPDKVYMHEPYESPSRKDAARQWKDRATIAREIIYFIKRHCIDNLNPNLTYEELHALQVNHKIEFWADYAATDWVAFYQLFGRMISLPVGFPMHCNDIQQLAAMLGCSNLPQKDGEHHALTDARNCEERFNYLKHRASYKKITL